MLNGDGVRLAGNGEDGLHGDVHDHETLGTKMERQDLEGIGDEQTRETDGVEDAEDPDEDNLANSKALLIAMSLVQTSHDGPEDKGDNHA